MSNFHNMVIGSDAFPDPLNIVLNIPFDKVTFRPDNTPYNLYDELSHINFWMSYYLALLRGENPRMPSSEVFYSPSNNVSEAEWQNEIKDLINGLKELDYLTDFDYDEERLVNWATVIIAHNAYHFGRIVLLRQQLCIWSSDLDSSW
jgi:hypothetical protein